MARIGSRCRFATRARRGYPNSSRAWQTYDVTTHADGSASVRIRTANTLGEGDPIRREEKTLEFSTVDEALRHTGKSSHSCGGSRDGHAGRTRVRRVTKARAVSPRGLPPRFVAATAARVGDNPRMEDRAMSIVVRFKPTSLTAETYDESTRQLEEAGVERRPDGLDYHVCFGIDGNLQVSEIWDSREQFEAFGERLRLMPVLAELAIEFSGPPEIFDVRRIVKR